MSANSSALDNPPPSGDGPRQVHPPVGEEPAPTSFHRRGAPPSLPMDRPSASSKPAPLSMRSSMREAPYSSGRDSRPPRAGAKPPFVPAKRRCTTSRPGCTSSSTWRPIACSSLPLPPSHAGRGTWHHTALVTLIALGVWMVGARVFRHYDAWSEGLFGELAVTSVLVISVGVSLQIFNQVVAGARSSRRRRHVLAPDLARASGSCEPPSSPFVRGAMRRPSTCSSSAPGRSGASPAKTSATPASTASCSGT